MASKNEVTKWAAYAVILVAVLFTASVFHVGGLSLAGGVTGGTANVVTSPGVQVTAPGGNTTLLLRTTYSNTNGNTTQVAENYSFYPTGATSPFVSGSTVATAGTNLNVGLLLGQAGTLYLGDGGNISMYYGSVPVTTSMTGGVPSQVAFNGNIATNLQSITFSNTSTFGASTIAIAGTAMAASATNTQISMTVTPGQYNWGDGQFELCAQFNNTNITSVGFNSLTNGVTVSPTMQGADPAITTQAVSTINCYNVQGVLNNYNPAQFQLVVKSGTGKPVASSINVWINDHSAYFNNGVLTPGYFTNNNVDLGLAIFQSSAFPSIVINSNA